MDTQDLEEWRQKAQFLKAKTQHGTSRTNQGRS